jgi:hypothetical protein
MDSLLAFYELRDCLLGSNKHNQDISKALNLAGSCQHPDAVWVRNVFKENTVLTREEARDLLLEWAEKKNDARALCYAALIAGHPWSADLLSRAAKLNDAYAQATLAWLARTEEQQLELAEKSAAQGEREGINVLGFCYEEGHCGEYLVEKAKGKKKKIYI